MQWAIQEQTPLSLYIVLQDELQDQSAKTWDKTRRIISPYIQMPQLQGQISGQL